MTDFWARWGTGTRYGSTAVQYADNMLRSTSSTSLLLLSIGLHNNVSRCAPAAVLSVLPVSRETEVGTLDSLQMVMVSYHKMSQGTYIARYDIHEPSCPPFCVSRSKMCPILCHRHVPLLWLGEGSSKEQPCIVARGENLPLEKNRSPPPPPFCLHPFVCMYSPLCA